MKIVVRTSGQKWRVVESARYQLEKELQDLLEQSPELIPMGDLQPSAGDVSLVLSEFHIPGSGYLDLLGFTSTGHIVLMECKLNSNPEIKRKVVGQLFEYAGFLWRMTFDQLDTEIRRLKKGRSLLELMSDAVQKDWESDVFRQAVEQNLATGRFVLTIVVDLATDELQRAAMFLNACGNANYSFHVLEMQRFQAGEVEVLTPHVHGGVATASSMAATATQGPRKGRLSKEQFLEDFRNHAPQHAPTAEDLYNWTEQEADNLGTGDNSFSFRVVNSAGHGTSVFILYPTGRMELEFQPVRKGAGDAALQQWFQRLRELPGFASIAADALYPSVWLHQALLSPEAIAKFKDSVLEVKKALKSVISSS